MLFLCLLFYTQVFPHRLCHFLFHLESRLIRVLPFICGEGFINMSLHDV